MSRVRLRRLQADGERIDRAFAEHAHIQILKRSGSPSDRYQVEFRLKGLALRDDQVLVRKRHVAEVYLPRGYPRQNPLAQWIRRCGSPGP